MSKILIGTSGYVYSHWENGIFYPKGLPKSKKLEYYSQHFKTVELNNTFYRLPPEKVFESWYKRTPKDFTFAVKVSRFITHIKKLKDCKEPWKIFLKRALVLKEKLGPFLFQLPPFLKKDSKKLKYFIKMLHKNSPRNLKFAFEFRHENWCDEEIYQILKKKNCAWVIADSPSFPKRYQVTANFVYVRMHGSKILFSSDYTKKELEELATLIKKWKRKKLDIFVYFNNDAQGFAVKNAKELINLL
jgi:uncharacterized protein YecE (DUF72 family)